MFKVLLVDDEPWTLLGLAKSLPWEEYQMEIVDTSTDSQEALNLILKTVPDVVFTDIRMPGMDGMELMERISHAQLNTQVVVVSGFSNFEYVQKAIREGAFDYLLKPIEVEKGRDLLNRLQVFLMTMDSPDEKERLPVIEHEQFQALVNYIQKNFAQNLSLGTLAEQFGLNPSFCSQLFKRYFSSSFSSFLKDLRLERARILLNNETLSVQEVAGKCGFSDYYYFNKVFKKQFGITPAKFRKHG